MYTLRCTLSRFVLMPASVTVLQPLKVPQGAQRTALPGTLAVHTCAQGFWEDFHLLLHTCVLWLVAIAPVLCLAFAAAVLVEAAFTPLSSLTDSCCVPLAGPASRGGSQHSAHAKQSPHGLLRTRRRRGVHPRRDLHGLQARLCVPVGQPGHRLLQGRRGQGHTSASVSCPSRCRGSLSYLSVGSKADDIMTTA